MPPVALSPHGRVRVRRGVGFLFFSLVALPCILLALVLSFDATRAYLSAREARNAATESAIAGSYQFQENTFTLNQPQARSEASATLAEAQRVGAMKHVSNIRPQVVTSATSVTVTVTFGLRGLSPLGALVSNVAFGGDFTVSATADICTPGSYGPTGGSCTRPEE